MISVPSSEPGGTSTAGQPTDVPSPHEAHILRSIRRIMRAIGLHSRDIHSSLSVTLPQLLCLHALAEQDGLTLQALSRAVNLSNSTVNGITDRLEAKQLITRIRDPRDRRRVVLGLTSAGRERAAAAPSPLQARFAGALRRLPDSEQAAMARALDRVVVLMEAQHLDASPNLLPGDSIEMPTPEPVP